MGEQQTKRRFKKLLNSTQVEICEPSFYCGFLPHCPGFLSVNYLSKANCLLMSLGKLGIFCQKVGFNCIFDLHVLSILSCFFFFCFIKTILQSNFLVLWRPEEHCFASWYSLGTASWIHTLKARIDLAPLCGHFIFEKPLHSAVQPIRNRRREESMANGCNNGQGVKCPPWRCWSHVRPPGRGSVSLCWSPSIGNTWVSMGYPCGQPIPNYTLRINLLWWPRERTNYSNI